MQGKAKGQNPSGNRVYTFKSGAWRPSSRGIQDSMPAKTHDVLFAKVKQMPPVRPEGVENKSNSLEPRRPSTAPESGVSNSGSVRRPMTPADNKPYATALRQLENERRVKVRHQGAVILFVKTYKNI